MILDLHSHTTCSDGTLTPDELVAKAKDYRVISITDHDTLEASNLLDTIPENYISGVEISAEFSKTLHILGYNFDVKHKELNGVLNELQEFRKNRNEKMLANMKKVGMEISWNELVEEAKGEIVGRPHFAKLMVKKGFVENFQEAFDKYLAKGQPLYLNKKRLEPDKAIQLILDAGGIPVMAHPFQTKLVGSELESMIKKLKEYGLQGIEAFYSTHTQEQTDFCLRMAEKYNLLITAGSDFHGANKPIELGMEVEERYLQAFLQKVGK